MNDNLKSDPNDRKVVAAYLAGILTMCFIGFLLVLFIGFRVGYTNLFYKTAGILGISEHQPEEVHFPDPVLKDLSAAGAVVNYANNPTGVSEHETILVRPDKELGRALRAGVNIQGFVLPSSKRLNFLPPVLYYSEGSHLSDQTMKYIERESRLQHRYTTTEEGFRTTVPAVSARRKVLLIGDSVVFGEGVNDEHTVASQLQQLVGEKFSVVNAGIGGLNGSQPYIYAKRLSEQTDFDALIFVICENDYWSIDKEEVQITLERVKSIADRFNQKVMIVLHSYMQNTMNDLFHEDWRNELIGYLKTTVPELSRKLGFEYLDWGDIVHEHMLERGSIFSRFELYADECHLSPLGNKLLAEAMFKTLANQVFDTVK